MDEAEGKKRIAFWETKKEAYKRKNNENGIRKAEATIKRINVAMGIGKKHESKSTSSVAQSERNRDIKSEDTIKGEDKGGLI